MRLLLDTHILLWALNGSLSVKARKHIQAADAVYVSAASIWEASIKARLGKLDADPVALAEQIEPCGFIALPISPQHAARVFSLPEPVGGHKDPFDRLLVAQALCEPLILLTADSALAVYGPQICLIENAGSRK